MQLFFYLFITKSIFRGYSKSMALVKGIENLYGTKFNYHKLDNIKIVVTNNGIQLRMTVDSYVDKEARMAGKKPVRTENIIEGADFALTPFYMLLKAKFADFNDAQDDFDDAWKGALTPQIIYTQQTPQGELISKTYEGEEEATTEEEQEEVSQTEEAAEESTSETETTEEAAEETETTEQPEEVTAEETESDTIALDVAAEQTNEQLEESSEQNTESEE